MNNEFPGDLRLDVPFIVQTIRIIGDEFLTDFRKNIKPDTWDSFKTQFGGIEERCMKPLRATLAERYPEIGWAVQDELTAPSIADGPAEPLHWRCDSMDGAVQYMMHLPGWTINLSLICNKEVIFSAIYDPIMKDLFWAQAGSGAFLNDARLVIGGKSDPTLVLAAVSHPPFSDQVLNSQLGKQYTCLLNTFGAVRNYGPTALQIANVGAGRIDLFFESGPDLDNWVAGILIAREAGAVIMNAKGMPWEWGNDSLVVANPSIAAIALENCGDQ